MAEIKTSVSKIAKKIKPDILENLYDFIARGDFYHVVALLLEYYYDPRYEHAQKRYETTATTLHMNDMNEGITAIKHMLPTSAAKNSYV